jgi:hypothetical protein
MTTLDADHAAIVRNAEWFMSRQQKEGYIDAEGDEFYGIRGDATLVGHSATVRVLAHLLTHEDRFLSSARKSLEWLAARQDSRGGWRHDSAFTLDGAQCVFEGFNSYRRATGDTRFDPTLVRAADRMISGVLDEEGGLKLYNIIEIGEYAHFAFLAYGTTREERFRRAGRRLVEHITRNFQESEGYWLPYDRLAASETERHPLRRVASTMVRGMVSLLPLRGRVAARAADHLLPYVARPPHPQYSMSLMDAEALLDAPDRMFDSDELRRQTALAVTWATTRCKGPFEGSLVESLPEPRRDQVYPLSILNDSRLAALWPMTCLLVAYCGLRDPQYRAHARVVADRIAAMQGVDGGFHNFQDPDGTLLPLQSGNVNFSASMALWLYGEAYGDGPLLRSGS